MRGSSGRQDYHNYCWKKGELLFSVLLCTGVVGALSYFFYRSVWAMLPLSVIGVLMHRSFGREKAKKRREELAAQFRECILSVSTSLQAGYSVENAFQECRQDMEMMYGGDSLICRELLGIRRGLNINLSLEELLLDLAERSGCEDVEQFAQIFALAKRSGGNLPEIIRSCADRIGKQMELRREINLILSAKKLELTIMKLIPFVILLYINFGNPGYFDALYHNWKGVLIMTACLGVYLGANWLGDAVMKGIMARLL